MIKWTITFFIVLGLLCCENKDTRFGKQYNSIRANYGSPILHDYMELQSSGDGFEHWQTPKEIHDTIKKGFHAGKGFYIHPDSTLQEDDIFRKRINDSTFAFVAIITFGNLRKSEFRSIYYDSVDERQLKLKALDYLSVGKYQEYTGKELTINEADSILALWGTSRKK